MQSSLVLTAFIYSILTLASEPGDKSTILTSGDKVFTVHYQLGQSTVLYFGLKPETVICGNKNYFNIEKIKEGLTVQPLANFSTNLTVLSQGRRYLFYLTPTKNGQVDTFIDVRWVPEAESHPVAKTGIPTKESVRELGQKLNVGVLDIQMKRIIDMSSPKRSIVEFSVKNTSKTVIKSSEIELLAMKANRPLDHQVQAFDLDEMKPQGSMVGRIIVTNSDLKGAKLIFSFLGKSTSFQFQGGNH